MRIEIASHSSEMLRACFELNMDFSVRYMAGLWASVKSLGDGCWLLSRIRGDKTLSSFEFTRGFGVHGGGGTDLLTYHMANSAYLEFVERKGGKTSDMRDASEFLEGFLRVYGGGVDRITSVDKD